MQWAVHTVPAHRCIVTEVTSSSCAGRNLSVQVHAVSAEIVGLYHRKACKSYRRVQHIAESCAYTLHKFCFLVPIWLQLLVIMSSPTSPTCNLSGAHQQSLNLMHIVRISKGWECRLVTSNGLCFCAQRWRGNMLLTNVQGGHGEGAVQQVRSSLTVISMAAMKQPHLVAERLDLLLKVRLSSLHHPPSPFLCMQQHSVSFFL